MELHLEDPRWVMSIGFRMNRGEGDDRVGDVCKERRTLSLGGPSIKDIF